MDPVRPAVAALLILLAAPFGGGLYLLGVELSTSTAVAVSTSLLIGLVLVSISRGVIARERATTPYW